MMIRCIMIGWIGCIDGIIRRSIPRIDQCTDWSVLRYLARLWKLLSVRADTIRADSCGAIRAETEGDTMMSAA